MAIEALAALTEAQVGELCELYQKEWYLDLLEPDPQRPRLRVQPFLDLLAQHLRELIGCERALGPLLNQPSKDFEEWMGQRDKQLQRLEEEGGLLVVVDQSLPVERTLKLLDLAQTVHVVPGVRQATAYLDGYD